MVEEGKVTKPSRKSNTFVWLFRMLLGVVLVIGISLVFMISMGLQLDDKNIREEKLARIQRWVEREAEFQKDVEDIVKTKDVLIEYFTVEEIDLAQAVIDEIIEPGMGDYERVKAVYDYVLKYVSYDYEAYASGLTGYPEDQQPIGALRDGKAVCGGYAHTLELLCVLADVECIYVSGTVGKDQDRHAWNKVNIDGVWYNVDPTWDDGGGYAYFLLSDKRFNVNRSVNEPFAYFLPECPKNYWK